MLLSSLLLHVLYALCVWTFYVLFALCALCSMCSMLYVYECSCLFQCSNCVSVTVYPSHYSQAQVINVCTMCSSLMAIAICACNFVKRLLLGKEWENDCVCWNGFLCPVEPESSSRVTGSLINTRPLPFSCFLSSTPSRLKVLAVEPLCLSLLHSLRLIYECNEWLKKANKKKITRRRKGEEWGASGSSDTRISSLHQDSSLSSSLAHPNTVFV